MRSGKCERLIIVSEAGFVIPNDAFVIPNEREESRSFGCAQDDKREGHCGLVIPNEREESRSFDYAQV